MNKAQEVVKLANQYVGLKETTGNNDGPIEIFTGGRKEPWCAHFSVHLYRSVGLAIPGDVVPDVKTGNPLASVSFLERVFKEHDWFYREPKPGDIIFFFTRGLSDSGPGRHCGIVESVSKDLVYTIEGNLSNKVGKMTYKLDNPRISGYGRLPEG
jgi:hypothetical protein